MQKYRNRGNYWILGINDKLPLDNARTTHLQTGGFYNVKHVSMRLSSNVSVTYGPFSKACKTRVLLLGSPHLVTVRNRIEL